MLMLKKTQNKINVSLDTVYKCWQYICIALQAAALVTIAILFGSVIFSHLNIQIGIVSSSPSISYPIRHSSYFAPLSYTEYSTLMSHAGGSNVTDEEKQFARKIFDYYVADSECMHYSEFTTFYMESLQSEEQFALMDINNDGVLKYDELVYVLTVLSNVPLLRSPEIIAGLQEIFGEQYSDDKEPECLAEVFFDAIDVAKNNFITKEIYIKYEIKQEWGEYNTNNDECVSFPEFVCDFFESALYQTIQEINSEEANGEIDIDAMAMKIKEAQQQDINELHLMFEPHQFDQQIESSRRRLFVFTFIFALTTTIGFVTAKLAVRLSHVYCQHCRENSYLTGARRASCYDQNSWVNVFGKSLKRIKDVRVGDLVFDGNSWSKIFYINKHGKARVKMNKISFGNPNFDTSLTLTSEHLLYKQGYELAMRSEEIQVGDVLTGINNETDYFYEMYFGNEHNYTVYDISTAYATPTSPITNSGRLIVDGVQTSVFSHSAEEHDRLQTAGTIFRWISDNIDEQMAVKSIDFYYNTVYKSALNVQVKSMIFSNSISSGLFVIAIPVGFMYVVSKIFCSFKKRSKWKMT